MPRDRYLTRGKSFSEAFAYRIAPMLNNSKLFAIEIENKSKK